MWAGEKWIPTYKQLEALKNEARKIGIPVVGVRRVIRVPSVWWRIETVMVRGKGQARYRDLKSGRFIKKP